MLIKKVNGTAYRCKGYVDYNGMINGIMFVDITVTVTEVDRQRKYLVKKKKKFLYFLRLNHSK